MRATLCSRSLADARSPEFAAASASSSMFRTSGSSDMGSLAGALSFIALYASTRILYHGQDEDDLRQYILCEPRHVVTVATRPQPHLTRLPRVDRLPAQPTNVERTRGNQSTARGVPARMARAFPGVFRTFDVPPVCVGLQFVSC